MTILEKIDKKTLETMILITLIVIWGIIILLDISSRLNALETQNKIQEDLIKIYKQRAKALNE